MKDFLKGYVLFTIGSYAIMGLYSKEADTKLKRILHYLPVFVMKIK